MFADNLERHSRWFGEHFVVKKIRLDRHSPVAAKSTSDDTICLYRSCASFRSCRRQRQKLELQLWSSIGEVSDTNKESLFSDAIAIESVPSPVIVDRQLRLLRTGLTFSGMKGAGYKGRISLIAFQF